MMDLFVYYLLPRFDLKTWGYTGFTLYICGSENSAVILFGTFVPAQYLENKLKYVNKFCICICLSFFANL